MPIHRQSNNLTMSRSSGASFKTNSATGFRDKNAKNAHKSQLNTGGILKINTDDQTLNLTWLPCVYFLLCFTLFSGWQFCEFLYPVLVEVIILVYFCVNADKKCPK